MLVCMFVLWITIPVSIWSTCVYLCTGELQSDSPIAAHLYAYIGMECNLRVHGTKGRIVATPSLEEPFGGFVCNTPFLFFSF